MEFVAFNLFTPATGLAGAACPARWRLIRADTRRFHSLDFVYASHDGGARDPRGKRYSSDASASQNLGFYANQ